MSFLFGKKNKGDKAGYAPPTRDGAPSQASGTSIPTANGIRPRGPGGVSSPAPGGESGNTPTPEQTHDQRGGYEQENQVCVLHKNFIAPVVSVLGRGRFTPPRNFPFCRSSSY